MAQVVPNYAGQKAVGALQIDMTAIYQAGQAIFSYTGQSTDPYYVNGLAIMNQILALLPTDIATLQAQVPTSAEVDTNAETQ
jgi:hypothetical protein